MKEQATLRVLRDKDTKNAIVFVHGFGGNPCETWGKFPDFLIDDPLLEEWDVYSLGYTTKLAPDFRGLWSANPSIQKIADFLYTNTSTGDLDSYDVLVFVAHSMGGLVVQRALLDREDLLKRTSHVFLFGTPSNGLRKAGWFSWFKSQVDDMTYRGEFITRLRKDWDEKWPRNPPPYFKAIAGDSDEFVPASSSLTPFLQEQSLVVPGNHLEIVKPSCKNHLSVQSVIKGIMGEAAPAGPWNAARVALQMLNFREAVDTLEAHYDELDDQHLIELSLALESLGNTQRALKVLEDAGRRSTDARGVLAGRLKRRWIVEGRKTDYKKALELYSSAYDEAASEGDHAQAFYHGINVCFLLTGDHKTQSKISEMARKVLDHCDQASDDFWCLGTKGEALLYLNDKKAALAAYGEAANIKPEPDPWQLKSMHSQACQLAAFLDHDELTANIDRVFRQGESS